MTLEIRYKKGVKNANSDGLSRLPLESEIVKDTGDLEDFILTIENDLSEINLGLEQRKDDKFLGIFDHLKDKRYLYKKDGKFWLEKQILVFYKNKAKKKPLLVVPKHLVDRILYIFHNTKTAAHTGRYRLYNLVSVRFYWEGIYSDLEKWVKSCEDCNKVKPSQPIHHGKLVPFNTTNPFEIVGLDIAGPFTTTDSGKKYILICIDYFTNWV